MKSKLIIILSLLLFSSCEDKVELDIVEGDKKLVVEGGVSDVPGPYQIKLTETQDVNSYSSEPFVSDAIIVIKENNLTIDTLKYLRDGIYQTVNLVQGVIGDTYQLYIKTSDGQEYESTPETMPQVPRLDSLYFLTKEEIEINTFLLEDVSYPFAGFSDPAGVDNFYRYKFVINGEVQGTAADILIFDDRFNDGQYIEENFAYELDPGDTVRLTQIATTQRRSQFLLDWRTVLTANGGPFDPPLSPLIGNIFKKGSSTDYANGYFQATSEFTIEEVVSE